MRSTVIVTILVLVTVGTAAQEPLTIEDVVVGVIKNDPTIGQSTQRLNQAYEQYNLTRAATIPNLALTLTPYSFRRDRFSSAPPGDVGVAQSAAIGLEIQQALPTSGNITAAVDHSFVQTRLNGETTVEQQPELRVGYSQPLFFVSSVVDTSIFQAGLRNAEIAYERAGLSAEAQRTASIREGLELFVDVASLRRSVDLLNDTIELLQRQIDAAELDREQGLVSDNAVLALQVTLNDRRETLFDTELALVQREQSLARIVGAESLDGRALDDGIAAFDYDVPIGTVGSIQDNPSVRSSRLGVEQARRSGQINNLTDRPQIDLSLRSRPLYPAERDEPENVSSSLGDYFDSDADIATSVEVSLRIPLLTRRERASREAIDEAEEQNAQIALEDAELNTINRLSTLQLNRDFLERRQELLSTDIRYQERRLRNEQDLLAAGASTELRVDEVALDLTSRENEAWQVAAELFLNALDILALTGGDLEEVVQ